MKTQAAPTTERTTDRKTIWVFTPSRTDPKDLEFILVQRQKLLQDAVERVKESALTAHKHHLLFVGPRGCGKTHLVTLVVSRLSEDDELTDRLRIAWLNEDETCTTLLEFLFKIHAALEKRYPDEFSSEMLATAYDMKQDAALEFVSRHLLSALGSRTLLVVAENLDAIFEGLGDPGQKQLRSFIQENPRLSIVATAQRLVEDLSNRTSPFFGFFQTEHLKPLNVEQATELLQNIASLQEKRDVVEFLATSRGRSRVRAIHHLSGGNHRIYIVLAQFITRDSVDALLEPFMEMVDELTPYYQERIRWLPPLQRKIVEYLCTSEGTVPVKEIARRLFATPQTISSQLQDLRERGYVEASQRGRESLYEISEPLMRICVEVKDNQRLQPLRLLVDFLRVWYDDQDLKLRLAKVEPASASRAYLNSAIQRNSAEGNLRKKIFLDDLQMSLPKKMKKSDRERLLQDLMNQPEAVALSVKHWHDGNKSEAIRCLDEAISEEATPGTKVDLLMSRARLHSRLEDGGKEIADYTAVIGLPGAPVEQVAKALFNRGLTRGQAGDAQREIADITAVIELPGAPVKQLAKALFYRGLTHGQAGDAQRAIADYTAVIGLPGAPVEQVADALFYRGVSHGEAGDAQREIDDYTAVIGLPGAPVERVANALNSRGFTHGQAGDLQRAIDDYTAVIDLPGAPVEQVADARFYRGVSHGEAGDAQREIDDYTAVIGLPGAPVEQVAMALFNRAITHGQAGDAQREIADYTVVIDLPGARVEQVADALVNRGTTHAQTGDAQRAIDDYTAVIDLPGATVEQVADALVNRGITHGQVGDAQRAIADYTAVIGLPGAPVEQVAEALYSRGFTHFQKSRKRESQADFEALVHLPEAPVENVVDAHLALSELHVSEGKWSEGFQSLQASLECGTKAQPAYRETATDLVGVLFSAGLNPEGRRDKVTELLRIYGEHQALPVLGEAVVQHIGSVFRAGEPFPSADNLEGWVAAWEQAAESEPDFRLSVRLLRTGIDYVKAGGKDPGILLTLTSPERAILEQALGLAEKDSAKTIKMR
ncbi:MAG: MarR family transcriptional regulator [Chthoniobacteraceae bacterium]